MIKFQPIMERQHALLLELTKEQESVIKSQQICMDANDMIIKIDQRRLKEKEEEIKFLKKQIEHYKKYRNIWLKQAQNYENENKIIREEMEASEILYSLKRKRIKKKQKIKNLNILRNVLVYINEPDLLQNGKMFSNNFERP